MITVVVLAKNEEKNLLMLLPTLRWADEVVVVDDKSSDKTTDVCRKFGVTRLVRSLANDYAAQRNFALSKIEKGWVLFLDADERLSDVGIQEIKSIVDENSSTYDGYSFSRQDVFYNKHLLHGETGNVRLVRLGKVGKGVWTGKVHEKWNISKTQQCVYPLFHYSHESVAQLFQSVKQYAQIRSRELFEQNQYWSLWEQISYPLMKFLYTYFIRLGLLDGWQGFVMSVAMSWHSLLVRWNLWRTPWKDRSTIQTILRYLVIMPWILLPFGQFTRGFMNGLPVYGFEVFMGLSLLVGIIEGRKQITTITWPPWIKVLGLVTGLWLLSLMLSLFNGLPIIGGLYWLRWCLYVGYGLLMWRMVWKDGDFSITGLIRYVAYLLLFTGIIQYLFFPDMRWLALLGWDDHYYRMIGSLFDPNYFGLFVILVAWWVLLKIHGWEKRVMFVTLLVALAATYSRASMAVAVVLAGYYGFMMKKTKTVLLTLALLVGVLLVLPKPGGQGVNLLRYYSITNRMQSWVTGWGLFSRNPITGIGFNQYPSVLVTQGAFGVPYHPSAPDNSWLFILATTGLLGFIALLGLIRSWWVHEADIHSHGALLAIILHSFTNNSFFFPWILLWWWLILLMNFQEKVLLTSKN